jgi:hypothetical protein
MFSSFIDNLRPMIDLDLQQKIDISHPLSNNIMQLICKIKVCYKYNKCELAKKLSHFGTNQDLIIFNCCCLDVLILYIVV